MSLAVADETPTPAPVRERDDLRRLITEPIPVADAVEAPFSETLLNFWNILVKWRWLIMAIAAVGLAGGVAATLVTTPIYRAATTIQINLEPVKVNVLQNQQTTVYDDPEKYYLTQYELLKSRSLAERVAQHENLADDAAFVQAHHRLRPGAPSPLSGSRAARIDHATDLVVGGLHIVPVRASRLVTISYDSPDPVMAARIANAVAASYISWNLERRYDASAAARRFLEDRLQQTRQSLEAYQRRGNDYAQQNRLITVGGTEGTGDGKGSTGESIQAADLGSLDGSLSQATAARIQAEQHWRKAQATADTALPEVLSDPSFRALETARDAAQVEYDQNLRRYKAKFPTMVADKAKIDALTHQIAAAANSVRGALKVQYENALGVETALKAEVERRKGELLAYQGKRVEESFINTDIATSRALYDSMLATYKQLGIAGAVEDNNISVVDKARPSYGAIKPQPMNNLMLFGAIGLALGVMLSFVLEQFDLSIKIPEEVEREFRLPVLATIPVLRSQISAATALENPKSQLSEGYYSARAALQLSTPEGVPSSMLVTSSMMGEGKSTSTVALASGFGRLGLRVLLIDADMRSPSLHRVLSRDNDAGLSNLLASGAELHPALQVTGYPNVTLLSSGPLPPNPSELLAGPKMALFLDAMKERFDMVIIDSPPIMGLADAPQLASMVVGVLMVIEAGATKRAIVRAALRRMRGVNVHLLGALFTKFDVKKAGYAYGYAYSYGYGRGYGFDYGQSGGQSSARPLPLARLARLFGARRAD